MTLARWLILPRLAGVLRRGGEEVALVLAPTRGPCVSSFPFLQLSGGADARRCGRLVGMSPSGFFLALLLLVVDHLRCAGKCHLTEIYRFVIRSDSIE